MQVAVVATGGGRWLVRLVVVADGGYWYLLVVTGGDRWWLVVTDGG